MSGLICKNGTGSGAGARRGYGKRWRRQRLLALPASQSQQPRALRPASRPVGDSDLTTIESMYY
jgi:hypothetical protein